MPRLKVSSVILPLWAGVFSCETFVMQQIPPASCQIRRHVSAATRAKVVLLHLFCSLCDNAGGGHQRALEYSEEETANKAAAAAPDEVTVEVFCFFCFFLGWKRLPVKRKQLNGKNVAQAARSASSVHVKVHVRADICIVSLSCNFSGSLKQFSPRVCPQI